MSMLRSLYGRLAKTILGIAVVVAAIASNVSGQAPAPASQDAVVAEIRALRADLNQRLEASIRMQLLVARLSLQEQRINTVVRQLSEVNQKVRDNATARASAEAGIKMLGIDSN